MEDIREWVGERVIRAENIEHKAREEDFIFKENEKNQEINM